jgi:hypothetical protein
MSFAQYLFSFLYVRNWHTGRYEVSPIRLMLFLAGVFLLVMAFGIVTYLQAPVAYTPAGLQ